MNLINNILMLCLHLVRLGIQVEQKTLGKVIQDTCLEPFIFYTSYAKKIVFFMLNVLQFFLIGWLGCFQDIQEFVI
jgi:hypothetical protein